MTISVRQLLVDPRNTPWRVGIDSDKSEDKMVLEVVSGCCKRVLHWSMHDRWVCSLCEKWQELVKPTEATRVSVLTVWDSVEGFSSAYYARQWVSAWLGLNTWNVQINFYLLEG